MDDIYQNAWSDSADPARAPFDKDAPPSWPSTTKPTSSYGEEADLAAPSWSTGVGIRWDEPSGSPGFSWSQSEQDAGWGAATYEGISLGKLSVDIAEPVAASSDDSESVEKTPTDDVEHALSGGETVSSTPSPKFEPLPSSPPPPPTPPLQPLEPVLPHDLEAEVNPAVFAPASPDAFGSFASGLPEDASPSPGFAVDNTESDPWGSAWADANPQQEEKEEVADEWERAKQEKAKQDRKVPPELLASILTQSEELAAEICPLPKESEPLPEKDAWLNDRRSGLDGVPGLNAFMETFVPPLTLQPPVRFSQALVAKKMASTVKLTKNLPLTRASPMSHYLSAKGSTAWEISVKERKEVVEDDVPIGWRIVEKTPETAVADASKDKKSGGLFSFWGRRQTQSPSTSRTSGEGHSRTSSVDKPKSPVVAEIKSSRRASQDSSRASITDSRTQLPSPSSESVSSQTGQPTPVVAAAVPSAAASYSSAPDPVPSGTDIPAAPSAVSRFLNRFSRRGSAAGNPRSSLALSSDDLEFLSDIVPSASDDADEDTSADALEQFVNAKREPVVSALPPPLAPPPSGSLRRPNSAASHSSSAGSKSTSPTEVSNDLDLLFGSFSSTVASGTAARPAVPALAPPISPSRPITPSSTPGAGPSIVSTISRIGSPPISRPSSRVQTSSPLSGIALPPPPTFKPITPDPLNTNMSAKAAKPPKLSFPLPPSSKVDSGPMSGSSTTSTAYETAGEASPPSPTSSLPLGQLYPHLVTRPTSPPQASGQALVSGGDKPAVFGLETPLSSAFPSTSNPPLLGRPPAQLQVSPIGPPTPQSSNLFGDDDDFSDFQSPVGPSSQLSPAAPPPISKSPRTLRNAGLRGSLVKPNANSSSSSFALPPPGRSATSSVPPVTAQTTFDAFDSDDFADFQESPMGSSAPPLGASGGSPASSSLLVNSASDNVLLTPKNSNASFGHFDDLWGGGASASLATPSPPRVPAKPALSQPPTLQPPPLQPPTLQPPSSHPPPLQPPPLRPPPSSSAPPPLRTLKIPPPSQVQRAQPAAAHPPPPAASASMPALSRSGSSGSSIAQRRKSHAAEHLHTLNLVERAAARSGKQWPAPPSPLPAALPAPSGGLRAPGAAVDVAAAWNFMDGVEEEEPAATSAAPLAPSFSSPAVLRPPTGGLGFGNGNGFGNGSMGGWGGTGGLTSGLGPGASLSSSSSLLQGWDEASPLSSAPPAKNAFASLSPAPSANGVKGSGLSAQDLSFFEGL